MEKIKQYYKNFKKDYLYINIIIVSILLYAITILVIETGILGYLSALCSRSSFVIFVLSIIIVSILLLIKSEYLSNIKSIIVNSIDIYINALFIYAASCLVTSFLYPQYNINKIIYLFILVIFFLFIFFRKECCYCNETENDSNLIELIDLYNGNIPLNLKTITLDERDVDYDLLNRESIINHLQSSINNLKSDHSFVIGIEGEWGSGKTTIINNAKKILKNNKDLIVIDDLDPWIFGSPQSMLEGLYDTMLKASGVRYTPMQKKNIVRIMEGVLTEVPYVGKPLSMFTWNKSDNYSKFNKLVKEISFYLERESRRFVFIIDNIERANSENILFLLKLIGTVFNFPNLIYVLSYSNSRLKKILESECQLDSNYMEKIIQKVIKVPQISRDRLSDICYRCNKNYLNYYGLSTNEIKEFESIMELIISNIKDLRAFKRLVNSIYPNALSNTHLNRKDYFSIEIIRFLNPELYYEIYNNRKFFISDVSNYNKETFESRINKEEFNKKCKSFYKNLFEKYADYKVILSELFPYAKNCLNGTDAIPNYLISTKGMQIDKNKAIFSDKYFDLYFTSGNNYYTSINKIVEELISFITETTSEESLSRRWVDTIKYIGKDNHSELITHLNNYIDTIPGEKRLIFALAIFKNILYIDDKIVFMSLNARIRAISIVESLIENISYEEVVLFTDSIKNDYSLLYSLYQLLHWIDHSNNKEKINDKKSCIETTFNNMCNTVVIETIDLYDDKWFNHGNVYGILVSVNRSTFKDYINRIFDPRCVYRVIADLIRESIGEKYGYSISKNNMEDFGLDETQLKEAIKTNPPKNDIEGFLVKVLDAYDSKLSSFDESSRVQTEKAIDYDLL